MLLIFSSNGLGSMRASRHRKHYILRKYRHRMVFVSFTIAPILKDIPRWFRDEPTPCQRSFQNVEIWTLGLPATSSAPEAQSSVRSSAGSANNLSSATACPGLHKLGTLERTQSIRGGSTSK